MASIPEGIHIPIQPAENDGMSSASTLFVDYVPPPPTNLQPPAKYKLWILVLTLVFFAEWFAAEAGVVEAIGRSGWLSPNASIFLVNAIIVFVLVFAALDLIVSLFTIRIKNRSYGIGPFLKKPRAEWVHRHKCFLAECLACIVAILEDGFRMLDAPQEARRGVDGEDSREYSCEDNDCEVVLKIEHRIDPSKMKEYNEWLYKIDRASARYARGLKDVRKSSIIIEDAFNDNNGKQVSSELSSKGRLHIIYLTFSDVYALNEWMSSPQRKKLIKELKPLLREQDIVRIRENRALPDAFTDLMIRQGESVPILTPKKWKVWWLTLLGLFFTQMWCSAFLPHYFDSWNLTNAHPRLKGAVNVSFVTFLNAYVMTPLLLFLFSGWIQRNECETDKREPWRTLNDGFESTWPKAILTIALYGGFAAAWAVEASKSVD